MTSLDVRLTVDGHLQEVVTYKRWSLTRGGQLQEVSLIAIWLMDQSGLWLGGRLREVVAQGGCTAAVILVKTYKQVCIP